MYRAEHGKPREVEAGASEKVAMKEEKRWGRCCRQLFWGETQAPHPLIICNGEASYTMLDILYNINGVWGHCNSWLNRKKFVPRSIVRHLVTQRALWSCDICMQGIANSWWISLNKMWTGPFWWPSALFDDTPLLPTSLFCSVLPQVPTRMILLAGMKVWFRPEIYFLEVV